MIRSLVKFGLLLLVCVLGYNYFFGDPVEKEQSERIFGKVKDVSKDAWDLLKTEKEKYKEGKYDGAVEKVGNTVESLGDLLGRLSQTAKDVNDSGALDRISELQAKQKELESKLAQETPETYDAQEQEQTKNEIQDLLRETETLMKDMENQ